MSYKINYSEVLKYGWEFYKNNVNILLPVFILYFAISIIANQDTLAYLQLTFPLDYLISFAASLANMIVMAGIVKIVLEIFDGRTASFNLMFNQSSKFLTIILAQFFYGLIVLLGALLLVFPGIYLALKYLFILPLIVDKNLGINEAFKQSADLTRGRMTDLLIFSIVMLLVSGIGALFFGIGILLTAPVALVGYIYVYRQLVLESYKEKAMNDQVAQ